MTDTPNVIAELRTLYRGWHLTPLYSEREVEIERAMEKIVAEHFDDDTIELLRAAHPHLATHLRFTSIGHKPPMRITEWLITYVFPKDNPDE